MEKIEYIYSKLKSDKKFFLSFKEKFIDFFSKEAKKVTTFLDESALRSIADNLYLVLFSFDKNPIEKLKEFSKSVAKSEIDLKPVFSKSFMYLLKNYIDFVIEENKEFDRIKNLVELIDIYLFVIDSAYLEYTKELEESIQKLKKEKISEEISIIFHGFNNLQIEKKEIDIIDFYKEVPVLCKGYIKDIVKNKFIILELKRCRYKNFYQEGKEVYIKADIFPKVVKSKVVEADVSKNILKLTEFSFSELPQERRKYVRVIPKDPIPIYIVKDKNEIKGVIKDISIGGVGVILKDVDGLQVNDKVQLKFELETAGINTYGTIRYINKEGNSFRVGIEFEKNEKIEEIIGEYVVKRQFEIIKEIRI